VNENKLVILVADDEELVRNMIAVVVRNVASGETSHLLLYRNLRQHSSPHREHRASVTSGKLINGTGCKNLLLAPNVL
jgi:hypothetical protein